MDPVRQRRPNPTRLTAERRLPIVRPPFQHPSDDRLELYALDRLGEPDVAAVDEHLLICEGCQERLALTDLTIEVIREAFAQ